MFVNLSSVASLSVALFLHILYASLYCTVHITNHKPQPVSTADADGQQSFLVG